jgi:uncharacterized protein involved in exopolysaccharide biosynthesis
VRKDVWAETQGANQVVVSAAYENPNVAYQLAGAAIDNYIQWRINADRQESAAAQTFFGELVATYQTDLDAARAALEQYLTGHPAPLRGRRPETEELQIERLQADLDLAQTRYASVLEKEESTRLALAQAESVARQTYYLIDAPAPPTESAVSLRSQLLQAGVFLAAGLFFSLAAVIGGAILDQSFRFPHDAAQGLGLPVLASLAEGELGPRPPAREPEPAGDPEPADRPYRAEPLPAGGPAPQEGP